MTYPVPIPYIGEKFFDEKSKKILFVGLESYEGKRMEDEYQIPYYDDDFDDEQIEHLYFTADNGRSVFWKWVKIITESVYGREDDSFKFIAWSNLHKCQVRDKPKFDSKYEFYEEVSRNCIAQARWIFKEIEILNPDNVVVFGHGPDKELVKIFLNDHGDYLSYLDISDSKLSIEKKEYWKNRCLFTHLFDSNKNINFIFTLYPKSYVNSIVAETIRNKIIRIITSNFRKEAKEWVMPVSE